MEKNKGVNIRTTFNVLSNGLNFKQKQKMFIEKEKEEKKIEEKNTTESFPNFIEEKKQIKLLQKKISEISRINDITEEKKEKKIKEFK